jgi:hypothetical protein
MDLTESYESLKKAFAKAYPSKSKLIAQKEINKVWNDLKSEKPNLFENLSQLLNTYESIALESKGKHIFFWSKPSSRSVKKTDPIEQPISLEFEPSSSQFDEPTDFAEIVEPTPSSPLAVVANKSVISQTRTKRQDELRCEIDLLNGDFVILMKRKNTGHITDAQEEELKSKRKKKESLESKFKKKKKEQERQKKSRASKREKISKLCETHPGVKEVERKNWPSKN